MNKIEQKVRAFESTMRKHVIDTVPDLLKVLPAGPAR